MRLEITYLHNNTYGNVGCGVSSSGIQNYISGSNEHAQRKIIIEYHLKCNNGQAWKIRKFRHSTANFVLYKA